MKLLETLIIIILAVGARQVGEYMAIHPPYSCPAICEVDHGHFFNGIDTMAVRKAKELPKKLKKILLQKFRNRLPQSQILQVNGQPHHLDEYNLRVQQSDASPSRRQTRK